MNKNLYNFLLVGDIIKSDLEKRRCSAVKISVCDDDSLFRKQVLDYINIYAAENKREDFSVSAFENGEDLLESVNENGDYDICILDIIMPGMNGIEVGKKLREDGFKGKIIYLTSSEEFAVASYKVKALDYIIKPFSKEEFFEAFSEAVKSFSAEEEKYILVKTKQSMAKLSFKSIMYAELLNRTVVYHLSDGSRVESLSIRTTFSEATQELLRDRRFVLCGASMVMNLCHITKVGSDSVVFMDKYSAYPSKKACRELRSVWCDFLFDGRVSR